MRHTLPGTVTASSLLLALVHTNLLQVNTAAAEPFHSYGGGLFVGWDFASDSVHFGVEGFGTYEFDYQSCSSEPRSVAGPLTRLSWFGLSRPNFTLTGFAGAETQRMGPSLFGELGATLGFPNGLDADARLSPHTGLAAEFLIGAAYFQQEWLLPTYAAGLGVRFNPLAGTPGMCVEGRPQRTALGCRTKAAGQAPRRGGGPRVELAAKFRRSAQEEYEAVPAFLTLAYELAAAGAPPALVQRSHAAARDELEHAALCTRLVHYLEGSNAWSPTVPRVVRRPVLPGEAGIVRLASESWLDGCLGEGLAAALAEQSAHTAQDEPVRAAHARVAVDEQRHAELGWDVVEWCASASAQARDHVHALCTEVPLLRPASNARKQRQRQALAHAVHQRATARWTGW